LADIHKVFRSPASHLTGKNWIYREADYFQCRRPFVVKLAREVTMDKIIITDLQATGIIGVKHPERDKPQILLINLTLYRDLSAAGESDNILDTINYSTISKAVAAQVSETHFHTVEALANHLSRFLLQNYPLKAVRIRVEKPKKVSNTARVGVEIFRRKSNI